MKVVCLVLALAVSLAAIGQSRKTQVSIKGEDFYINNEITLKKKVYNGMRLEGLLPNSRMVQGIFDDYNEETQNLWLYPDTKKWDANRNTNEFIAAMPAWKEDGLLAFTINLQGGSPFGYSSAKQTWINSAFLADGKLDAAYMKRLERILDRADELGMIAIVGYFYFGQDQNLKDEAAVIEATRNATKWIVDKGYNNVLIEINNECDINSTRTSSGDPYNHAILDVKRVHELINIAKSMSHKNKRLPVSTSFKGGAKPSENVLQTADFVLIHGNGVKKPEQLTQLIQSVRSDSSYKKNPIVVNEDDHFDFDKPQNNFLAATKEHVSWGFFDYRMKDEGLNQGYQSLPVDWSIGSERKKQFFELLKKMTQQ
ncbi:MAG TPA: hypothetical protein VKA49_17935 [Flavitalea sp.]|nr:hypothetical protein [Flavitalea sp.]